MERLSEEGIRHRDRPLFLRFVEKPLGRAEYLSWRRIPRERLSATGRFTTTGVFGRLIDAGLRASLLLRGKVPAGLAAAAETTYRERLEADRFTYYGRVVRDGGYVCLQYWFFYAMNDWRSTFSGINDHEADWEMVTIYLAEPGDGPPRPAWVAFSSHDYHGDDLRRRWDDPELHREGDRAGGVRRRRARTPARSSPGTTWSRSIPRGAGVIRIPAQGPTAAGALAPLHWRRRGVGIPFVDYARGDGVAIGPGHDAQWTPVLIDDDTPWVRDYRGLWGLDTRDRFGGERAPSGPRYERDGSVRASWANPLGWAGLLKVPPSEEDLAEALRERVAALDGELEELDPKIEAERAALRGLRAEARSLSTHDYARALADRRQAEVAEREAELNRTIALRTSLAEERRAHLATLAGPIPPEPPRPTSERPTDRAARNRSDARGSSSTWAAVSTPLLLGSVIVVLVASPLARSRRSPRSPSCSPGWRRSPAGACSRSWPACCCSAPRSP